MPVAEDQGLINAHRLAEALDVSVETVWKYTRENRIPYVKLGERQYRYRLEEVLAVFGDRGVRESPGEYQVESEKEFTYDDYLNLPDEPGHRFEVLGGMLVREPSPNVMHQRVLVTLLRIVDDYFQEIDAGGETLCAPLDVTLGEKTVVQPDLLYVASDQQDIVEEKRIDGAPHLVVEILSRSHPRKDRLQKLQIYQRAGVPHYWIVDPDQRTLECFSLRDGIYALVAGGMDDDVVCSPDFSGLRVSLDNLWQHRDL